jgi:hypothetical protein
MRIKGIAVPGIVSLLVLVLLVIVLMMWLAGWLAFANVGGVTRRRGVGATHYRDVSQDFTLTREARW